MGNIKLCIMTFMASVLLTVVPVYADDTVMVVPEMGDELEFEDTGNAEGKDTQTVILIGDFEGYPGMPVIIEFSSADKNIMTELKAENDFREEIQLQKGKYNIVSVMAENDFAAHYPLKADTGEFVLGEEPVTVTFSYEKRNDPEIEEMDKQYIAKAKEDNLPKGRLTVKCIASDIFDNTLVVPLISRNGIRYQVTLRKDMLFTENVMLPVGIYSIGEITGENGKELANTFLAADKTVNIKSTDAAELEIFKGEAVKKVNPEIRELEEDDTALSEGIPEKEESFAFLPVILAVAAVVILALMAMIGRRNKHGTK